MDDLQAALAASLRQGADQLRSTAQNAFARTGIFGSTDSAIAGPAAVQSIGTTNAAIGHGNMEPRSGRPATLAEMQRMRGGRVDQMTRDIYAQLHTNDTRLNNPLRYVNSTPVSGLPVDGITVSNNDFFKKV